MAQTNFTPILTYKSDTATVVPSAGNLTNSANGAELAVNTADKRLFTKDSGGNVVELGTNPSSLTLPNSTANGVVYANGSKVLTTGSALTFDGAALRVGGSIGTGGAVFTNNEGGIWLNGYAAYGSGMYSDATGQQIRFQAGGSEQMRLTSTGLGIGTSSPSGKLSIGSAAGGQIGMTLDWTGSGGPYAVAAFTADRGTGEVRNYAYTNFFQTWYTNNSEKMRLDASGNLGLGVTPSAWVPSGAGGPILQIQNAAFFGSASTTGVLNNAYYNGGFKYISSDYASWYEQIDSKHVWYTAPSGTAGDAISFTQALTLHASGGLSLGNTTDPGATNLSVSGEVQLKTAAKGIRGSSAFSVTIANGASATLLDLAAAMLSGSSGIVSVAGASAGKTTILCQRDQGGYYSIAELGTQPRGTYITSISLSGTNLQITNSTGGSETFSGSIVLMY